MCKRMIVSLLFLFLCGCTASDIDQQQGAAGQTGQLPVIYVANYPLAYFVERIGGPVVEVRFPASVSGDPAYWQPKPEDITAMQASELIVLNGASYEQWLANVSLPASKIVETAKRFEDIWIPLEGSTSHSHGLEGEHEHSDTAFTTWLDMKLAVEQARTLSDALVSRLPDHASHFEDNYARLEKELLEMDAAFETAVSQAPDTPVIFSHPVYQYFERRYGVRAKSVHWEPDEVPDENMWGEFNKIRSEHKARLMLWEGEPISETVRRLDAQGIQSAVFDPCGNKPETGDFLEVMTENLSTLKRIYSK